MAYYIPLPDGRYAQVPDNVDINDARRQIYDLKPDYFPEAAQRDYRRSDAQEESTAFGRGLFAGGAGLAETMAAVGKYAMAGVSPPPKDEKAYRDTEAAIFADQSLSLFEKHQQAQELRETVARQTDEDRFNTLQERLRKANISAAEQNPEPTTWEDVQRGWRKGVGSAASELATYVGELAGGSVPYAAASIGGAAAGTAIAPGAGTLAGAAAPWVAGTAAAVPLFVSDNIARQVEEGAKEADDINWLTATTAGTAQASLNAVGPILSGMAGRAAQGAVIRQMLDKAAKIPLGRYMAAGVGSAAVESFTEAGQTALERLQAGLDPFDDKEIRDAMIGGGVLGLVMGPLGAAASRPEAKQDAPVESMSENETPAPAEQKEELLALPAPETTMREPVFDFRPEPDESAQDYANRAISVASAEFPEGPYEVEFLDGSYRVMGRDRTPIGQPFARAEQAQEVAGVYNVEAGNIETNRLAKEAIRKTQQQETATLAAIARETVAPLGTFTIEELGPKTAGQVNIHRTMRGLAATDTFTMEDLARAKVSQGEINRLIQLKKPNLTADTVTVQDVQRAAEEKNLAYDDNNFQTFALRTTGRTNINSMSQTQLKTLLDTVNGLPVSENKATIPIVEKPLFTEQQYDIALGGVRRRGRFTNTILAEESGIKDRRALKSLREAMVRRGQLVQRAKNDYRLYDVLGGERQDTPADIPAGATTSHAVRELPVSKVKVLQNGKSVGTFNSPSAARDKVRDIRRQEADKGARPSNVSIEADQRTAYGVIENRYDTEGNLLGQVVIDSYREKADAEKAASAYTRTREESDTGAPPVDKPLKPEPVEPEALRGRVGEVLEAVQKLSARRALPLLGVQTEMVDTVTMPNGRAARGVYDHQLRLLRVATSALDPDMTTSEIIESISQVMDHEMVHALHLSGVLGPDTKAWKTLSKYVKRAKRPDNGNTYYQHAKQRYANLPDADENLFIEEGIAEAFRVWAADKRAVTGQPATAFRQMVEWFRRLIKSIASMPDNIFGEMESGQMVRDAIRAPGEDTERAQTVDQMQVVDAQIQQTQTALQTAGPEARNELQFRQQELEKEYQDLQAQARENRRGRQGDTSLKGFTPPLSYARDGFGAGAEVLRDRQAKYIADQGLPVPETTGTIPANPDYMKTIADRMQSAKNASKNPDVAKQYNILKTAVMDLYRSLGEVELYGWQASKEAYTTAEEAATDLAAGNLSVRPSNSMFGMSLNNPDHPMLARAGVETTNDVPLNFTDLLRIVADAYGHMAAGNVYTSDGSYNAYHVLRRLVPEEAHGALAAEMLAPNAWHNYGPQLRRPDGSVPLPADADFLSPNKKEFAPHKAFVVSKTDLAKDPFFRQAAELDALADDPSAGFLLETAFEDAGEVTIPDPRYMLRDEGLGDIRPSYADRFKSLLPGGKDYGKTDRSPGGELSRPGTKPVLFAGNADGNKFFSGPMVDAQLQMAREGARGSELIYMSPEQYQMLTIYPEVSPDQDAYNEYVKRGYGFSTMPSLVVKGDGEIVDVVNTDGGFKMQALAAKGVNRVPVIMYPENRKNTKLVRTLRYKDAVMSKPPNSENYPNARGEYPRYMIDDKFGNRVPPVDQPKAEFDAVLQHTEGFMGRFLKSLGRSERKVPILNMSIFDIRVKAQDSMLPVKKYLEDLKKAGGKVSDLTNTYLMEQLFHERTGERIRKREKNLYLPLLNAIKQHGKDGQRILKSLEEYLYARHATERNRVLREAGSPVEDPSGISDDDAKNIIKRLTSEGDIPAMEALAVMVDNIIADTNRTRLEGGLISQEMIDQDPYEAYVPLRGYAEEDLDPDLDSETKTATRVKAGRGFSIAGREDVRAAGRKSKAGDILGHVFLQNTEAVIRAEKNRVAASFAKLVEQNPGIANARILGVAPTRLTRNKNGTITRQVDPRYKMRDDIVTFKNQGKEVSILVGDKRVARAIKKDFSSTSNAVVAALGALNRYLSTINTSWNPEFLLTNLMRDLQTAGVMAAQYDIPKFSRRVVLDSRRALGGIREVLRKDTANGEWAKEFKELQALGGTTGFLGIQDLKTQLKRINGIVNEATASKPRRVANQLRVIRKFVEDYNNVAENAARLSAFVNAKRMGVSPEQAAFIAKNLTVNFNKGGENKAFMNSVYLFYNASLQGSFVLANALARSKKVRALAAGLVMAGFTQDMLNQMILSGDEDGDGISDYDQIPQYILEHNYVLMDPLGILEAIGVDKGYIAIPMPYGLNAFHNAGRNLSAVARGSKVHSPAKAAGSMAMTTLDAFNPVGGSENFFNFVAPTIFDPAVDLLGNRDFADRPIVPEQLPFGVPKPDSQLYWNSTAEPFKWVTGKLNELTGGNAVRSGLVDVSPETLEYAFDYMLGAAGAFAKRSYDFGTTALPDMIQGDFEDVEIGQIPFLRKFVGNVTDRQTSELYYDVAARVLTAAEELEHFAETRNAPMIRRTQQKYASDIRMIPLVKDAEQDLRRLRSQRRDIKMNEQLDPEVREKLMDQISDQMDAIMTAVNQQYYQK